MLHVASYLVFKNLIDTADANICLNICQKFHCESLLSHYRPNVCRTDRVYSTMKHSYSYKRECFFFFCYLHCEESEECNGEAVNVTKSEVDCCEGFGVDPTQSNFGGRDKSRYRRHGSTRFSLKKSNGCPISKNTCMYVEKRRLFLSR